VTVDALFDLWERAWSGRDPAAFAPLCAPSFHYEDPLTPEPLEHPDKLASHALRLWHAFPDARLNRTGERLTDGRFAVAPARLLGTHEAPVAGVAATHRELVVHVVFYCELQEGRLHRVRAFFDAYGAAVQLGILPRRGTPGQRALLMLRGFGITR
jgi:steroid delta-isomerase-like uncharacterized protein